MNIFYGQNYSGKTTLSRIIRSFEKKELPPNYDGIKFSLKLDDGSIISEKQIANNNPFVVKVFNEDYIQDNLHFLNSSAPSSKSFAVLGEKNVAIEKEIENLELELGCSDPGKESGLYAEQKKEEDFHRNIKKQLKNAQDSFSTKLTEKGVQIKRKANRYGVVVSSYDKIKLKNDIKRVLQNDYQNPSEEEIKQLEQKSEEKPKQPLNHISSPVNNFSSILSSSKELCERKIGTSSTIQELIYNSALAEWVDHGIELNKDRKYCAFCGQEITSSRWDALFAHFNKDAEKLKSEIASQIDNLKKLKTINEVNPINISGFYAEYQQKAKECYEQYAFKKNNLNIAIESLIQSLQTRKGMIVSPMELDICQDIFMVDFSDVIKSLNSLIDMNNQYTTDINKTIKECQEKLQLSEVYCFQRDIHYSETEKEISELETQEHDASLKVQATKDKIQCKLQEIIKLRNSQIDNKAGVYLVNHLLHEAMPSSMLKLEAVESDEEDSGVVFEILRDTSPAFNMSEGERNLIAFCYFIASLSALSTNPSKQILLWIDDPVSSLDHNNIFATYGILENSLTKIIQSHNQSQIFIATHNLIFLRYLKMLKVAPNKSYFFIRHCGDFSVIESMPLYLKKQGTEFNYWFQNIVECAESDIDDSNMHWFESFSNNARKFFEFEYYFKYPYRKNNKDNGDEAASIFWGKENKIPQILTEKMSDENSHSLVDIEAQGIAMQAPEIRKAAFMMLQRIKDVDSNQYKALLKSVNKTDPLPLIEQ